jgi:hypothetical protein
LGRNVAMLWHASFSILAGVVYYLCVLPRWYELMGQISPGLGTTGRITCGFLIGLAALPVVFTLVRTSNLEYGAPQLALRLRTASIVAHVLAGVLIVGTAISELWFSLDRAGQWLFGVYGAAAAVAVIGFFAFYLSFLAELPPPPPKPGKPKKPKRRRRSKGPQDADAAEDAEDAQDDAIAEAESAEEQETPAAEPEPEPVAATPAADTPAEAAEPDELPVAEDTIAVEAPRGGLRNRRPTGKSSGSRRRRRLRGGVALDD